jgi:hypothetical protein
MIPTMRKYSMTTVYATMNLRDLAGEVIVKPVAGITVRGDVRRLWLASSADLWYAGSGATQNEGTYFGYAGRRSGGSTDFAPIAIQSAIDVALARHWSANAFFGGIHGGQVVQSLFPRGDWLRFSYLENVVQW